MTLGTLVREQEPSAPAIFFEGRTISYGDLERQSNRMCNWFKALGLKRGDRVTLVMGNDPNLIAAYFGAFKAGIVANPVHDRLAAPEVSHIIQHAEPGLIVAGEGFLDTLKSALALGAHRPLLACIDKDAGEGFLPPASFLDQPDTVGDDEGVGGSDAALLLYTSGTTGRPKGVLLSQDNIFLGCLSVRDRFAIKPTDRTLCVMPLSHTNALMFSTIPFLMAGASVALGRRFSASRFWGLCREYKVNTASVSPSILTILLDTDDGDTMEGIKLDYVKVASAPTSPELARRFEERFGAGLLLETYGLTETTTINVGNPVEGPRKRGSIGTTFGPHEVKIVDGAGNEVAPGEAGEIMIRTPTVMLGYFRDPDATSATIKDGWVASGDLGRRDEDGYIFIVGRKKDTIIRGGENVSPLEVEQVIGRHPAVLEAAVVGVPDRVLGEEIAACVVLRQPNGESVSEEELIAFCAADLASFKVPRRILFVEALPRNAIGKFVRRDLLPLFAAPASEALS